MISNPCKQCIVSTMCKETCDPFIEHVETILKERSYESVGSARFLAHQIKKGNASILKEGLFWRTGGMTRWRAITLVNNA